jgi:integrase
LTVTNKNPTIGFVSRKNQVVRNVGDVFIHEVHLNKLKSIRFALTGINNKSGNFRVRVKATNSNLGCNKFGEEEKLVVGGIETGRAIRIESFMRHEEAMEWTHQYRWAMEQREAGFGLKSTTLDEVQLSDAQIARSLLPKSITLCDVAKHWLEFHGGKNRTVSEAFEEWMQNGKRTGLRLRTLEGREQRTNDFRAKYGSLQVREVKARHIEEFVFPKKKKFSLRNSKNILMPIKALLEFCVTHEYIKVNPAKVMAREIKEKNIPPPKTILDVEVVKKLIDEATAHQGGKCLAYLSVALFCGLRPDEIHGGEYDQHGGEGNDPLTWKDFKLEGENPEVFVQGSSAKTRKPRQAPLPPNCLALLKSVETLPIVPGKGLRSSFQKIYKSAGIVKWETDIMRRSWASYLYNFDKKRSMVQIARVAGNSARILDKHYIQNLPDGEGKKYFAIGGQPLKGPKMKPFTGASGE